MKSNASVIFRECDQIPLSHREAFEYVEHAKIVVDGARVVAKIAKDAKQLTHIIPTMNTAILLLGPGCSISSDAIELLSAANVSVGMSGGMETPLNGITDPVFLTGVSEYRPTEYMQNWASWWFDEEKRVEKGRLLLTKRVDAIEKFWSTNPLLKEFENIYPEVLYVQASKRKPITSADQYKRKILKDFETKKVSELLGREGIHVKSVYSALKKSVGLDFMRDQSARNGVNGLLTTGNYISYGLAASVLHGLGVSFAFPILHGKTRRGGLVFDVADIIKDAIIAPVAFAHHDVTNDEFRRILKENLFETRALDYLFNVVKEVSEPI